MKVSPRVRLRFHGSGPDGRQTMAMDVDVALFTRVIRVRRDSPGVAVWTFNGNVVCDAEAELSFRLNGASPTVTTQQGDDGARCVYDDDFIVGDPWSIALAPGHVVGESVAIVVPQSGVVIP